MAITNRLLTAAERIAIVNFIYSLAPDAMQLKSRIAQGKAIDAAKGIKPPTEEEMAEFTIAWSPDYLKGAKGQATESAQSHLYRFIKGGSYARPTADGFETVEGYQGKWNEMKNSIPKVDADRVWMIIEQADPDELEAVMDLVVEQEAKWRRELQLLGAARDARIADAGGEEASKHDLDEIEEWWSNEYRDLVELFTRNAEDIPGTEEAKAAAAYYSAYCRAGRSGSRKVSYPWTIFPAGIISLVSKMNDRTSLVVIKECQGSVTAEVTVTDGVVFNAVGDMIGKCVVGDGKYPTYNHHDRFFIKVPNTRPVNTAKKQEHAIRLVGFKDFGFTAKEVYNALLAANGIVAVAPVKNRPTAKNPNVTGYTLGIVIDGVEIGVLDKRGTLDLRPCTLQLDMSRCSADVYVDKNGLPAVSAYFDLVGAKYTQVTLDRNAVRERVNMTASYWQDKTVLRKMADFGIVKAQIVWAPEALPSINKLSFGTRMATVALTMPNGQVCSLDISVSGKDSEGNIVAMAGNGKPELVLTSTLPTHLDFKSPVREQFVASLLAFVNWSHAEMWVRWKSSKRAQEAQAQ